jgi:hypothetical protein
MAHVEIDAESRIFNNVLEARRAATDLGLGVLVHLLDMVLVEMGGTAARNIDLGNEGSAICLSRDDCQTAN